MTRSTSLATSFYIGINELYASRKQAVTSLIVMRSFSALLSAVIIVASASASASVSIPMTKLERTGSYLKGFPHADRARASYLKNRKTGSPMTVPASDFAYVQYTTSGSRQPRHLLQFGCRHGELQHVCWVSDYVEDCPCEMND
ncbi:hypothetical protein DFH29DRAFT_443998 [Suillus ampliporus]|nr:hypothetical protein DFH29DRAFT_443998 [Suillus ampliporus]